MSSASSAAGVPYPGTVPAGHAIRILTGAVMPAGSDTVVLEEDIEIIDGQLHIRGTLKQGANRRLAGEDIQVDDLILQAGRKLTPTDEGGAEFTVARTHQHTETGRAEGSYVDATLFRVIDECCDLPRGFFL